MSYGNSVTLLAGPAEVPVQGQVHRFSAGTPAMT
jgi:hypothetical protein